MFAAKFTLFLALFAASAQLAVAVPPACLLAAVNTESKPSDLPAMCGSDSSKVKAQIKKLCGDNTDAAMAAYKKTCSGVSGSSPSSSSSPSSTEASDSASATGSETASTTGSYSTGAPFPIVYTSTYYDHVCSCTKTAHISSTGVSGGSTGFATGTAPSTAGSTAVGSAGAGAGGSSGSKATGSPIVPTATPSSTSPSAGTFTGAASKNLGSFAAAAVAVVGFAVAL